MRDGKWYSMLYVLCWYLHPVTENQGFNTQCLTAASKELDRSSTPIGFLCNLGL